MNVRVLVADDFPLVREGLAAALEADPEIEVVGQASNGQEAIELALDLRPDVVLLDIKMPGEGGLMVLERLREHLPDTKVLVVTASEKARTVLDAVAAGAAGYLTKRVGQQELCQAVITVHGGGSVMSPRLTAHVLEDYVNVAHGKPSRARPLLSQREEQVIRLVSAGLTDKEIGERLYLSPRTIQSQLTSIRRKTGLHRRSELVRWAIEHAGA
jgi:DNA-binding NarL/FixJ family response regulator